MPRRVLLLLGCALALAACGAPPPDRPDDFALVYAWDTGSLPPEHQRSEIVRIVPSGQGVVAWSKGYGDRIHEVAFQLDATQFDALWADLSDAGLFEHDWAADPNPPVGGSSWTLRAVADERQVSVPRFVTRHAERRDRIGDAVASVVPAAITAELQAWSDTTQVSGGG